MKPVYQIPGDRKCLSACIASLMEIELERVPLFEGDSAFEQRARANEWHAEMCERDAASGLGGNLAIGLVLVEGVLPRAMPRGLYVIASGPSPRSAPSHAVLMLVGEDGGLSLAHDPHPSGAGLAGEPTSIEMLVICGAPS